MDKLYKLCIFDVDGTLVETKSGATFRKTADDWKWLPHRLIKLHSLYEQGARVAIASNQGGVAFGYMQEKDIVAEITRMCQEARIPLGGINICCNMPTAPLEQYRYDDPRRKPAPGMLREAMQTFDAKPEETLMVGDREEDMFAAKAAGCHFEWAKYFFGDDPWE